jgi:mycothiol synthase
VLAGRANETGFVDGQRGEGPIRCRVALLENQSDGNPRLSPSRHGKSVSFALLENQSDGNPVLGAAIRGILLPRLVQRTREADNVTSQFRLRTGVGVDDLPAMAELRNRCSLADGVEEIFTVESLQNAIDHAVGWDPARDQFVAEIDGVLAGWSTASIHAAQTGEQILEANVRVDPDQRGRGIERALLRAAEARLRERAAAEASDGRRILSTYATDTAPGAGRLFESEGFRPVRYYFHMVRPDLEALAAPNLPDGFEVGPVRDADLDTIFDAEEEAFSDEWLEAQPTPEDRLRYLGDPRNDPRLWQVAWSGGEVAGIVFPAVDAEANARDGRRRVLLDAVAIRRPFRRRGLATALMLRAMHAARDAGLTSADLWVDSANPSGALRIYERLGFEIALRSTAYHKELEVPAET